MDLNLQMWLCIILSVLLLVLTLFAARGARLRTTLFWLGVSLLPAGAFFAGLVPHLIEIANSLVAWWQKMFPQLTTDNAVMVGAALLGLGLLLIIVSRLLPIRPRRERAVAPVSTTPAVGSTAVRTRPDYAVPTSQPTPSDRLP